MNTQHTPRPWRSERRNAGSSVFVIYGPDSWPLVKTVDPARAAVGEPEANAHRIVQCVNAHDDLIRMLDRCEGRLRDFDNMRRSDLPRNDDLIEMIVALRARATAAQHTPMDGDGQEKREPLACPQCGATNADDAGELCIGEYCPLPEGDFDEALRQCSGVRGGQ